MGVIGLWNILENEVPVRLNTSNIKGETVAVDLATWICEAENVDLMKKTVPKPYLRNLLFRIKKLLCLGLKLVFVADGTPPKLKHLTINQRLNVRDKASHQHSRHSMSRKRLDSKLNKCCQLLDALGIPWLKSEGEAEASCAALNALGRVDACATNDGDVFLYGAKKVYRNLTADKNGNFQSYETKVIEEKLKLNRDCLISLALLLGCDYCAGVSGIGKVHALKWLQSLKNGENPLEKMRHWKRSGFVIHHYSSSKPTHCSFCKHLGSKREHSKSGCRICGSQCKVETIGSNPCNCLWHVEETHRKETEVEDKIIQQASQDPNFPDDRVIEEFKKQIDAKNLRLTERKPSLRDAVDIVVDELQWSEHYAVETILPIFTYWILTDNECVNGEPEVTPISICRTRTQKHIPVYEMEWKINSMTDIDVQMTREPQDMVKLKYPHMVASFNEREKQEKERKKALKKTKDSTPFAKNSKISDFYTKKKPIKRGKSPSETTDVECVTATLSRIALSPIVISSDDDESKPSDVLRERRTQNTESQTDLSTSSKSLQFEETFSSLKLSAQGNFDYDASYDMFAHPISITECSPSSKKENKPIQTEVKKNLKDPRSPVFMSLTERIRLNRADS